MVFYYDNGPAVLFGESIAGRDEPVIVFYD